MTRLVVVAVAALCLALSVDAGLLIAREKQLPMQLWERNLNFTLKNTQTLPTPPAPKVTVQSFTVSPREVWAGNDLKNVVRIQMSWTGTRTSTGVTDSPQFVQFQLNRVNSDGDSQSASSGDWTSPPLAQCTSARGGAAGVVHNYDCGIQINPEFPNGPWNVSAYIVDNGDDGTDFQQAYFSHTFLSTLPGANVTFVSYNSTDRENPAIHEFSIWPTTISVDAFGNHQEVTIRGSCHDDKDGTLSLRATFAGAAGNGKYTVGAKRSISVSGQTTSTTLLGNFVGTWKLVSLKCYDSRFNLGKLSYSQAADMGFSVEINIERNAGTSELPALVRQDEWSFDGFNMVHDLALSSAQLSANLVASNARPSCTVILFFAQSATETVDANWVTMFASGSGSWFGQNVKTSSFRSISPYQTSGLYKLQGVLIYSDFVVIRSWGFTSPEFQTEFNAEYSVLLDGTDGTSTGAASLSASAVSPLLLAAAAVFTAVLARRV